MLSLRTIAVWAVVIVLVGVGVAVWLLLAYTGGDAEANRVQLDAIRTAGTIVVGTGGAAALLLAARRQRSTEIALRQTDREQVTDLYTKGVEQLGSEKAPIRLGGLYALERLAQDNPGQRQTIVNVLCAYLRMPYVLPGDRPADDADDTVLALYRDRVQEREVRLTAQRILSHHLDPGDQTDTPANTFWPNTDLDLTGATLIDFYFGSRIVRNAHFSRATFIGDASFSDTRFTGDTSFNYATFTGDARFDQATFTGDIARFLETTFTGDTWFQNAKFTVFAGFINSTFSGDARFYEATFANDAVFLKATFTGDADFTRVAFTDAVFDNSTFAGAARFNQATFTVIASFYEATFAGAARFEQATLPSAPFVNPRTPSPWTRFDTARFAEGVPPEVERFVALLDANTSDKQSEG